MVTDDDHPIVTSTIRRELPAMSDEEFNEVDRLSKGKLRHLLVGSPSGYEWTKEVAYCISIGFSINFALKNE